mmetsp:Transcript_32862/g.78670  ORF Transcript_32862/g.78670 Transcript_32862/m.78670 type:complete len:512 (-) Transcript_32862:56-1591(-)|eukprot:CAMPEP_0181474970 /NCGR_PEP_ID=MMETSP1110-20121109/40937_1 /TAXON_ID=174948 /ORGANISM="Symbiodinium sp., Strain CCMP421" /LENGTH=511 /DNA_ID=CAMNT_0023600181 /DNA_START=14 /DNA_END=1549 /DNA_ORIENTATION=+
MAAIAGDFDQQVRKPRKKPPWNTGHYYDENDVVGRVRTVVRSAKIRQQLLAEGKEPGILLKRDRDQEVKFWRSVFDKYDADSSGALDFEEITDVVREDLKIPERTLSRVELRDFYSHLDLNGDMVVDWHEWLDFVSQGKLRDTRPIDQVLTEVGGALRLGMRRRGLKPNQVEQYIRSMPQVTETVDVALFFKIFRRGLVISRHDCPDDNLKRTFASLSDGASHVPLQDVIEFLTISCLATKKKEIGMGTTFPGLIGGMRHLLPQREPHSRPGTFPFGGTVSGPTTVPFALNGRRLPPTGRLSLKLFPTERQERTTLRPVISCPDLTNHDAQQLHFSEATLAALEAAQAKSEETQPVFAPPPSPKSPSLASPRAPSRGGKRERGERAERATVDASQLAAEAAQTLASVPSDEAKPKSMTRTFDMAMGAAKSLQDKASSDPFAVFLKVTAAAETAKTPPAKAPRPKRCPVESASDTYRVIVGKESLNRVERRLFEAGVDVRGGYHRHLNRPVL